MNDRRRAARLIALRIQRGIKAARFPRAVVLALDKLGVDLHTFRWKLATGRLAKDYEIMLLLGARTVNEATRMVSQYISADQQSLSSLSMRELKEKRYIDSTAIRKAREIMGLMNKPLIGD